MTPCGLHNSSHWLFPDAAFAKVEVFGAALEFTTIFEFGRV